MPDPDRILAALGFAAPLLNSEREILLAQGAVLLDQVANGEFGAVDDLDQEILDVFQPFLPDQPPQSSERHDIHGRLKNRRVLDVALIPAMLATVAPATVDSQQYYALQAWVLYCAIGLVLEHVHRLPAEGNDTELTLPSGHYGIQEAARRVRLLAEDHLSTFAYMPDFTVGLDPLYRTLEIRSRSVFDTQFGAHKTLQLLFAVTRNYVSRRLRRIQRERESVPEESISTFVQVMALSAGADDNAEAVVEYQDRGGALIPAVAIREQIGDRVREVRKLRVRVSQKGGARSRASEHFQAQAVVNRLAMRDMHHVCDWQTLTDWERMQLLSICWKAATAAEPVALILVLMLLLGRSFESLSLLLGTIEHNGREQLVATKFKTICLGVDIDLPVPRVHHGGENLLINPIRQFLLYLPNELALAIRQFQRGRAELPENIEQLLRTQLQAINAKYHTRLTPTRIAGDLSARLLDHADDPVDIDLICGVDPIRTPALFYYAPIDEWLSALHRADNQRLLAATKITATYVNLDQLLPVGSRLQVLKKYISALFSTQAGRLRGRVRHAPLEEFHNEFTLYVYQILALATGYRPVIAPFERRTDFDLIRGTLWISEKESRSGLAARVVVLPELVIEQVRFYDQHLMAMANLMALEQSPHADTFRAACRGDSPYLLMFSRGKLSELRPRLLVEAMSDRFPIPLNWGRHFLRTTLREHRVPGHLVNAWLGHEQFGDEAGGPWSGLSYADMRTVAATLDTVLSDLGLRVMPGLGGEAAHG